MSKATKALLEYGKLRTKIIVAKIKAAMAVMELEIDASEGIYRFNGGRLSKTEVCRRAGIPKGTLQGASHKDTTGVLVDEWIKRIKKKMVLGNRAVRKAVTMRADDWESRYLAAARSIDMYHLENLARDEASKKKDERIAILEQQLLDAQVRESKSKVVRMSAVKKPR